MGLRFDEICIDAADPTALGQWWSQALGWPHDVDEDGDVVLHPPPGAGPNWLFLRADDKDRQEPHPLRLPPRRSAAPRSSG